MVAHRVPTPVGRRSLAAAPRFSGLPPIPGRTSVAHAIVTIRYAGCDEEEVRHHLIG